MTELTACVTGTIARIETQVGAHVAAGDVVLVIEAMKSEIPIEAPLGGRVTAISVKVGDSVLEGDVVATVE